MITEKKIISFLQFQLPLIAWCVFVYTASSIPSKNIPALGANVDKIIHFGVYGVLCWLAHVAFHHQQNIALRRYSLLAAVAFTVIFGLSDEFHQLYTPGRSAELLDIAADTFGGVVYSAIYFRFRFYRHE